MELEDILSEVSDVEVKFGDKMLKVKYRPGNYTPKFESDVRKASKHDDADWLSGMLGPLLVSWDLTHEDKTVGTDVSTLRGLPTKILSPVLMAILEDMSPKKKPSDSSESG